MPQLLVTIDTEPDLPKRRAPSAGMLTNIPALLTLQQQIPDVRLTLLVTHSVVTDTSSLRVLERVKRDYDCEIGAHLHPEETPPFVRGFPDDTSLMRLPFEARAEKLRSLTDAIAAHFPRPVSYRAGRWKLNPEDLGLLGLPAPVKQLWDALRPVRPTWLRPTYSSAQEMTRLADRLLETEPASPLNMMFHSNELAVGGRPFIRRPEDAERIVRRVMDTCRYLTEQRGVRSTTLGAYVAAQQPAPEDGAAPGYAVG